MPTGPDRLAIGQRALKAGALREALLHFREAASQAPDAPEPQRARAQVAEALGEFDEARDARQAVCALEPSPRSDRDLGLLAHRMGDLARAAELLERALAGRPAAHEDDPAEHLFRLRVEARDPDAAVALARRHG